MANQFYFLRPLTKSIIEYGLILGQILLVAAYLTLWPQGYYCSVGFSLGEIKVSSCKHSVHNDAAGEGQFTCRYPGLLYELFGVSIAPCHAFQEYSSPYLRFDQQESEKKQIIHQNVFKQVIQEGAYCVFTNL